jgi:hypothetical protein
MSVAVTSVHSIFSYCKHSGKDVGLKLMTRLRRCIKIRLTELVNTTGWTRMCFSPVVMHTPLSHVPIEVYLLHYEHHFNLGFAFPDSDSYQYDHAHKTHGTAKPLSHIAVAQYTADVEEWHAYS